MDWMLLPFKHYADFNGRSRRKEYWLFQLLNLIVSVFFVVLIIAGMPWDGGEEGPGALFAVGVGLLVLWYLAILVPSVAVTVRRFHDQDKSGWMFLINFIPGIGGWIVLVFMLLDGTRGDNSYGPDPKDPHNLEVFA